MKVLIVGSGGREHALAWKLSLSPLVKELYCAPGNGGISQVAQCLPLSATDLDGLVSFAEEKEIDLTVVGPEQPLVLGIVDLFSQAGLRIVGPTSQAAKLEGSKAFCKELLRKKGVPTAEFAIFSNPEEAWKYARGQEYPLVIKADGLAAGKGVTIAKDFREARGAIETAMVEKRFGAAGRTLVIEEYLSGEEASFIALVDANRIVPLASSQDHKPLGNGDTGPNTGGMGAYSPAPVVSHAVHRRILTQIIEPVIAGLREEGIVFRGVIYAGLMITKDQPFLLEFNVRFGDPEMQPILMRLKEDLAPLLFSLTEDGLPAAPLAWDERSSVCVVMTSAGYPESYQRGLGISGLEKAAALPDIQVFHAATKRTEAGWATDGGRVLGVTSLGATLKEAVDKAYLAVNMIQWDGAYFRRDIGWRGLAREQKIA